jgi:methionyl-tRNA synthetase
MTKEKILVTSALPYANGPLHVGHAIGAYIPADLYVRYNRMKGNDVVFVGGTDEHGTPIAVAAEKEGVSPQVIVDRYHEAIKKSFVDLGISFDNFSRTTRSIHYETSQQFFKDILEKGFIYKKVVERPYCNSCKRFLPDRYVRGICPHCESKDERGDQCEACGKQLEPHELKESYCVTCRSPPVMKSTEHWFFKLSGFSAELHEWIDENRHWPDNARNFSLGWIKDGLEDRAITRDLSWGVPVPVEGAKGKVLYVWFDAPIGYISATKEWAQKIGKPEEWKKYWQQEDTKIVHFLGKDNIPFHAIIWPAMLMAHKGYTLPWQISSNEYLTLEGKKMSTSRNWVLWLHDALAVYDPDVLRYYLMAINPEKKDADFSLKDFQLKTNSELIGTYGNFVNRGLTFIEKNGSVIPKITGFDALDEKMQETIREAPEKIGRHIAHFKFLDALKELMAIAHFGNEYFQRKEPWKNENATTLYLCANLCRTLAILSCPFLPFTSEKIWKMLNLPGSVSACRWEDAGEVAIPEGHRIGKVSALFKKIEDPEIEAFGKKYLSTEKKEETKMDEANYLEFEDFKKTELRIGVIKEVAEHPKADKLYVLKVDLGEPALRQIVAGIRNYYTKEELLGKKVAVVANLKPAELRGVKSEGMLLAADIEGKAVLLTPDKEVPAGSKIR